MIDLVDFHKHSLFGGFQEEDMKRIGPLFEIQNFNAHDYIIKEGKPNEVIYFLTQGSVRVYCGDREIIDFIEGDCFGEIEMLDTKPAAATIRALEPVVTACLSHQGLHQLSKLDPKLFALFMMNLARDLARRLRRMDELMVTKNT